MNNDIDGLIELLKNEKILLFIGAGFSESCGFPSSGKLIRILLDSFGIEADNSGPDKHDLLLVSEYLKLKNHGNIAPIIEKIQEIYNGNTVDISKSRSHLYLTKLRTPVIYTTNYDNLIEKADDYLQVPYKQIVSTTDIIKADILETTQIIKYHGSLTHPESMVLTESDYFNRIDFETAIDIRLRSDVLKKGLLFMGYSFSDYNIRYLWFKLRKLMHDVKKENLPQSFILLDQKDPITAALLENRGIIPLYLNKYPGKSISEKLSNFLESLVKALS